MKPEENNTNGQSIGRRGLSLLIRLYKFYSQMAYHRTNFSGHHDEPYSAAKSFFFYLELRFIFNFRNTSAITPTTH